LASIIIEKALALSELESESSVVFSFARATEETTSFLALQRHYLYNYYVKTRLSSPTFITSASKVAQLRFHRQNTAHNFLERFSML
jgi:hypothetical protein